MFKKRSKRALSHIDWVMSLSIFLLYLGWFFVFVKPVLVPAENMDTLLNILEDGVKDVLFQETYRLKVFVPGAVVSDYEPIVIPFDYGWQVSDIANSADYFVIDEEKMFFLGNLSNTSMFDIYYPHKALKFTLPRSITSDEDAASVGSFTANFDDYLIDSVFFGGTGRITGSSVTVDDVEIDSGGTFERMDFIAKYKKSGPLNISSYVFAENSKVYSYISSGDRRGHSVDIDLSVYNYTYFYFDSSDNGKVKYSIAPECRYHTSDFLDLYGSGSGFLLTFDREVSIRLCTNETNILLKIEFDISSGYGLDLSMIFHEGGLDAALKYPLMPAPGAKETLRTVSSKQVSSLRSKNYGYLKQVFHYPDRKDFNITISSDVVSASYGIVQPEFEDVYARRLEGVMIDENYDAKRALITLTAW